MSSFFTKGRLALLRSLQSDGGIDDVVKTWLDHGPGVRRRTSPEPASCPAVALAPGSARWEPASNAEVTVRQVLRIEASTGGQDVAPCEGLAAMIATRIDAGNADCLGLAGEGLASVAVRAVSWSPVADSGGAILIWTVALETELIWRRR